MQLSLRINQIKNIYSSLYIIKKDRPVAGGASQNIPGSGPASPTSLFHDPAIETIQIRTEDLNNLYYNRQK